MALLTIDIFSSFEPSSWNSMWTLSISNILHNIFGRAGRTSCLSRIQSNPSHTLIAFECVAVLPPSVMVFYFFGCAARTSSEKILAKFAPPNHANSSIHGHFPSPYSVCQSQPTRCMLDLSFYSKKSELVMLKYYCISTLSWGTIWKGTIGPGLMSSFSQDRQTGFEKPQTIA